MMILAIESFLFLRPGGRTVLRWPCRRQARPPQRRV